MMRAPLIALTAVLLAGCLDPVYGEPLDTSASAGAGGDYPSDVSAVFDNNTCTNAGCHGGGSASGGVGLEAETCNDTVADGFVVSGDAAGSTLYIEVEDGTMPIGSDPLSQADLDIIAAWINDGAACE